MFRRRLLASPDLWEKGLLYFFRCECVLEKFKCLFHTFNIKGILRWMAYIIMQSDTQMYQIKSLVWTILYNTVSVQVFEELKHRGIKHILDEELYFVVRWRSKLTAKECLENHYKMFSRILTFCQWKYWEYNLILMHNCLN